MFLASALASAFLRRRSTYFTDFSGQRPGMSFEYGVYQKMYRATLGGLELFGLTSASDATRKSPEGNDLLVIFDICKISVCFGEFEA